MDGLVCPEPLAAAAGLEMFRRGGNAFDAAVAAAFAQGVVNPFLCGIGGTSVCHLYHADSAEATVLHAGSATPLGIPMGVWLDRFVGRAETVGRYIVAGEENQVGYRSAMTPGFVRGAQVLFDRYGSGRVTWREALEPSITLARDGFAVYPYIAPFWLSDDGGERPGYPSLTAKMAAAPATAGIYQRAGQPYRVGDTLVQSKYADTLERLATHGAEDFYSGEIAHAIAADFAANDGWVTLDDLRQYQAVFRPPIDTTYRGRRLTTVPPPSNASGLPLAEMLRLLDGYDLARLGHNSAAYLDLLGKVMRVAFRDNAQFEGDPDFVAVPIARLLGDAYIAEQRALIDAGRSDDPPSPGAGIPEGTTHLTAVDRWGNVVAWTHSLGSVAGAGAVTGELGFLYNNFMGHFDPRPNRPQSITPGKRMGGGCATIIYEAGRPIIGIGAPGGSRLVSSTVQAIVNALDFGLPMDQAVAAPRCHSEEGRLIYIEPAIDDQVAIDLGAMGNDVQRSTYMSRVQGIRLIYPTLPPRSKAPVLPPRLELGSDPRGGVGIAAWP